MNSSMCEKTHFPVDLEPKMSFLSPYLSPFFPYFITWTKHLLFLEEDEQEMDR